MSKRHIPAIVFAGALLLSSPVFAQETSTITQTPTTTSSPSARQTIRNNEKTAVRDAFKERLDAAKIKYQTQREALMKKLEGLKDEKKKAIIEKISDKIAAINERRTTIMSSALKQLTTHLDRVQTKITEAKGNNINTSSAKTALASAKQAITSAETAVTLQAGKTYTINVTTDEKARAAVGATLKLLETDLLATHQKVVNARLAVMNAVRALALLKPGTDEPNATNSAN